MAFETTMYKVLFIVIYLNVIVGITFPYCFSRVDLKESVTSINKNTKSCR